MSTYPEHYYYSKEHEWVSVEGDIGTAGITFHAQKELGDIVYVDLPKVGAKAQQGAALGSVESVKAVSDIYAPVSGRVVESNAEAKKRPELVNQDPYGEGWLIRVALADPRELDTLLTARGYEEFLAQPQ